MARICSPFLFPVKNNRVIGPNMKIFISILRNRLLKACAKFIIERSEIRKKQYAFKSVHFECRMVFTKIFRKKEAFFS